ncbi:hypothetical protein N9M68_00690 [Candidatus Poseidonia alphae]|nr:hypothetical protein [Candidatus Poseidonia alphae]
MGIDLSEENHNEFEEKAEEKPAFTGRQSPGMNGNTTNESSCALSKWNNPADGLGGPVWQSSSNYTMYSIVEWPANSGEFYQTQINSSGGSVEEGHWEGPCTCAEIAEFSVINWDATVNYNAWQIVLHNGSAWIAQDAGTTAGDEPVAGFDLWVQCTHEDPTPCDELIGMSTATWDSTTLISEGDIYEYPANSSNFYMVAPLINNQTVGAPGVDLDAWDEEFCDCKDIWGDSGQPVWDASITYPTNSVVEWPSGSSTLYIAWAFPGPGDEPDTDPEWRHCSGELPSGNPCEEFQGYGGMPWYNTSLVSAGEIYEFPAGSGEFYTVSPGISNQTVGAPGIDFDAWSTKYCSCDDIWMAAGSPVWDSNTVYSTGMMVEYPTGTGDIWMALVNQTTTGVTPDQPFADGNQWELCSGESNNTTMTSPCAGLNVVGVWDASMNVTSGEVYEYPANSQTYYQVNAGSPFWSVSAPDLDMDVWSPIDCPCKETWVANGQPVWNMSTVYWFNEVVEWPVGSGILWIALDNGFDQAEPTLTSQEWKHCADSTMPSSNPCAGLTVVGVWDASMNVTSGEIYEYPVNSDTYYQVNAGSPFWSVNAPDIDLDVWSPIDCPCKETWAANGEPVWVSGTAYPGNYVVEWPANSGDLYIPLEPTGLSTGAGEPGVDSHWVLCNGNGNGQSTAPSIGPCAGLNVSTWDNTTAPAVGDIYQYPANSNTYYEIIFTHADANGGPNWVADPTQQAGDEFWKPYTCPCKETWVANGEPVWDSSMQTYAGNYVVEWPANSGMLYISEGGGITGAGEPGVDGHWIPCDGNPETEPDADSTEEVEADSIPSIGVIATLVGIFGASALTRRIEQKA